MFSSRSKSCVITFTYFRYIINQCQSRFIPDLAVTSTLLKSLGRRRYQPGSSPDWKSTISPSDAHLLYSKTTFTCIFLNFKMLIIIEVPVCRLNKEFSVFQIQAVP